MPFDPPLANIKALVLINFIYFCCFILNVNSINFNTDIPSLNLHIYFSEKFI